MKAIYARQSLEKKNSLSIQGQIDLCKRYIAGGEEYRVYSESKSGKNTSQRPEFLQMLSDIQAGSIDAVIVYRLDRISRNVLDFCSVWEIFKAHRVQFISCNENFDTSTPMGEAMLMIAMVFAQMERATIIERVTDNYFSRAQQGFYLGGYPPFGLKKTDVLYKGKRTCAYEEDEAQAEVLRLIYEQYAGRDISLGKLGEELTRQGYRTGRGSNWSACSLGRVLRSPVYVKADARVFHYLQSKGATMNNDVEEYIGVNGCYVYAPQQDPEGGSRAKKKRSGRKFSDLSCSYVTLAPHRGLIDAGLWLRCQEKLDRNKQVKCDRSGTHSWLSGLMRCANCGYGITVVNNSRGRTYINCYGKKIHACPGRERAWQLEEIERAVSRMLLSRLKALIAIEGKEEIGREPPEADRLRREAVKLEERVGRLLDELEAAKEEKAGARIEALRRRLDQVTGQLEQANQAVLRQINAYNRRKQALKGGYSMARIAADWEEGCFDLKQRQLIARTFIRHVVVGNRDIQVVFY